MQDQIAAAEDWSLKFTRQFYDSCLERLGEDHAQTRGLLQYMTSLEYRLACTRSELTDVAAAPASSYCSPGTGCRPGCTSGSSNATVPRLIRDRPLRRAWNRRAGRIPARSDALCTSRSRGARPASFFTTRATSINGRRPACTRLCRLNERNNFSETKWSPAVFGEFPRLYPFPLGKTGIA